MVVILAGFALLLEFLENSWSFEKKFRALENSLKIHFFSINSLNLIDDKLDITKKWARILIAWKLLFLSSSGCTKHFPLSLTLFTGDSDQFCFSLSLGHPKPWTHLDCHLSSWSLSLSFNSSSSSRSFSMDSMNELVAFNCWFL